MSKNSPTKSGIYLAHCGKGGPDNKTQFWTLIAMVHGTFPFFRVTAWKLNTDQLEMDFPASSITEWGPRIETEIEQ